MGSGVTAARPFSFSVILITWSIGLRLVVYLLLPPAKELAQYGTNETLFFSALTDHFSDYFTFSTNIPPATYLINAGVLFLFGVKTALHIRAFLLLVFAMDMIAVMLLFNSSKRMGAGSRSAFYIAMIFSAALIPFELWREGMHYDHYTVFFTAFFAWSIARLVTDPNSQGNKLLVSLAAALLVSQSAVNAAVAPVSVIMIVIFLNLRRKQYRALLVSLAITLLLPALVLIAITRKNQNVSQESLTSNKGGPAMMMVVQRAYNYDIQKIRSLMKEIGAPDWYLWTYDHATVPINPVILQPYPMWLNLAQGFGICFFGQPGKTNNPWDFDFNPLLQYLRQQDLTELAAIAAADSADATSRPYRFAGYSPELSPRWIGTYGDISKKIYFRSILKNPLGMLKAFIAQQGVFALYGPLFPYDDLNDKPSLLAHSGLRTLRDKIPLHLLFVLSTLLFAVIAFLTYVVAMFNIPNTVWRWVTIKSAGKPMDPLFLLSIPLFLLAVVFSCLVGGENDRYFMQVTPYIVILASCLPLWFVKRRDESKNLVRV